MEVSGRGAPQAWWRAAMAVVLVLGATWEIARAGASEAPPIRLGVYYYPGWSPAIQYAVRPDPWAPLRRFPELLPAKGEYRDGAPAVLRQQLDEMGRGGLSFVVFDTYIGQGGAPRGDQAIEAYRRVATAKDPGFALLWANHDAMLRSLADWDAMLGSWLERYLRDRRYLRVNGKPLVFIFSAKGLEDRARSFGSSTAILLARAQARAREAGLPGIAFVAGGGPQPAIIKGAARAWGYAALSDYNMGTGGYAMAGTGYARRVAVYRRYWEVYRRDADLPVILPITAGWDRTPWGGSDEDGAMPAPAEFAGHLREALAILARGRTEASRLGVICCWNEYGEGSVLEPTRKDGAARLKALRAVLDEAR